MDREITIKNKTCELMKAVNSPKYGSRTVLTDSCWEYASLFLKRQSTQGSSDALFYWNQAHSFYLASLNLPDDATPLTSYYCILNATKALLRFKGVDESKLSKHGISSVRDNTQKTNLKDAKTKIKGGGVLPELAKYYDCVLPVKEYSLFELMYNIPCVHRTFTITFSKSEMYIPVEAPVLVKKDTSNKAWLKFEVTGRNANTKSLKSLPNVFERDYGYQERYILRIKKRFNWDIHTPIEKRKGEMLKYHKHFRKYLYYIYGDSKLWYIKKQIKDNNILDNVAQPILIYAVFHWLSELVRYKPKLFHKYMKSKQNWLLHEFINKALDQFVDEIGCEITGNDIMCTGYKK